MSHRYTSKAYALKYLHGANWERYIDEEQEKKVPHGRRETIPLNATGRILTLTEGAGIKILEVLAGLPQQPSDPDFQRSAEAIRRGLKEKTPLGTWAKEFLFLYHMLPTNTLADVETYVEIARV